MRLITTVSRGEPMVRTFCALLLGVGVLSLSSRVSVPFVPVPMTLQTLAIGMLGALYGWRLGAATVVAWLACAASGLPVLAGPAFGIAAFVGPTAGYLYIFPACAALSGIAVGRRGGVRAFAGLLAASLLGLAGGWLWLAPQIGTKMAFAAGVLPFLMGEGVKAGIGATLLSLYKRS